MYELGVESFLETFEQIASELLYLIIDELLGVIGFGLIALNGRLTIKDGSPTQSSSTGTPEPDA